MRFPKYQWMQEEPINDSCGFCDVLYKSQNVEGESGNSFQVILDTVNVLDNKFTSNPFNEVTSNDLTFELPNTPNFNKYFTLYIVNKIYVLKFAEVVSVTPYTTIVVDANTTIININIAFDSTPTPISQASIASRLLTALNDIIDVNHGTTSSVTGSLPYPFTIANIPSGSYIEDNIYNLLSNIATITPAVSGIYLKNGYYNTNTKELRYLHINDIVNDAMTIRANVILTSGLLNIIKFYYNSVSTTFTLQITIDDGISTPTVYNPTVGTGGVIQLEYIPTNTGTHTIELSLTDTEDIKSGFSLERILIQELILLSNLEIEDCYGNITSFEYDQEDLQDILDNIVDNVLRVKLIDNYPEVFRFIITDSADNTLTSRWYKVADKDDCTNGKLYSVKWTNGCNLGEIDYSALPFTNELLLSGVLLKSDTDLIDSVENITASGRKISIYKNTQSVYEFRMHPYLSDTFEIILEGIFAHDTVTIDGIEYNTTDKVQISELDLGVYTGRVDLYKDGTNLITKNCC